MTTPDLVQRASGMYPEGTRISFTTTASTSMLRLTPLTTADANNSAAFSPDMTYYVDSYSGSSSSDAGTSPIRRCVFV